MVLPNAIIINNHVNKGATQGPQEHTLRKSGTNKLKETKGIQYMEFLDTASI